MTTATKTARISPFDAISMATLDPNTGVWTANRFGIGYSQRGFAGNDHFPDRSSMEIALEARLADLRRVYGTPAKNWTGRFVEEEVQLMPGSISIRAIRFIPIRKDGKRGKAVHTVSVYPIRVTDEKLAALSEALKQPVI